MIRKLAAVAITALLLHACAKPQPMGEGIWRAVPYRSR